MGKKTDPVVLDFLKKIGQKGGKARAKALSDDEIARISSEAGKARAAKYDKATLRKWGKLGGRPPKQSKRDGAE